MKLTLMFMGMVLGADAMAVCCNPGGQPVPAFNIPAKCKKPHVWVVGNSCNPPAGCCKSISGTQDDYCAQRIAGIPQTDQYKMCIADMNTCKWSCTMIETRY